MADQTEPRLLIVETSGHAGLVALAEGPTLRGVRHLDEWRRHARDLAPAVGQLLDGAGWRPRDLHGIIVSRGPGSYTGLRVALMSAKALAYATGCALLAVDTFATIAGQAPEEATTLDVIADAQQEKVYVQRFGRTEPGALVPCGPLEIRPLADWLADLGAGVWVSGPGLAVYSRRLGPEVQVTEPATWNPGAESLLRLGLGRYRRGERDDPFAVEPLYLRPSAAEQQWERRAPTVREG
jgi:tRNA threonylcarbamoyladenosine biosynthesis protein TsaB